jgi:DNA-binding SARP family transcriptional activator
MCVLGSFDFRFGDGRRPPLSSGSQRLLAFLALRGRAVARETAAGVLWPEASEYHAGACLRSAIARLGSASRAAVEVTPTDLRLAPTVNVDLTVARRLAARLVDPRRPCEDADLSPDTLAALSLDVLPDWYDDWVSADNEAWHQLRLHGLEVLTGRLARAGRFADAISAALAAVHAEPLRESARRALIRIHLAEGNQSEAYREYERFRALLRAELDVEPTAQLTQLVHGRARV